MKIPTDLEALVDADILRYEVGFAAEAGWREITGDKDSLPPFDYVQNLLNQRLESICANVHTTKPPRLFLTEGKTFRFDIAKTKPYKGTRPSNKPWHYKNLSVYMYDVLNARMVTEIEADDAISIEHSSRDDTIICSRDKDLRQVPGWFYSWELGRQPSFGPELISKEGNLSLSNDRKKLTGTGLAFFYSQVLTGDRVDNIPGLDKCGPVAAYSLLGHSPEKVFDMIQYEYGDDDLLLEQGRLCWMTRNLHPDGSPMLWELGMED